MKQLIVCIACAALAAAAPAGAIAQGTKSVKGSVTSVAPNLITVKVADKEMTFSVDEKTRAVAPGGSTKEREAKAEGESGPTLSEIIKVGQAVEVSYQDAGMHASMVRAIAVVPPAASTAAPAPKALTATGVVTAVSGNSLTVKGKSEWTFVVDDGTRVSGTGLGTAGRKLMEAGGKPTLPEFVHDGDTVAVTYHDVAGANHATVVRITVKKR
jgi:cytoskeletal protein RodZ